MCGCFPRPTFSLESEQTLKDLKSSGLHWNSPQGLNISSIRVFYQIRDPEIPMPFAPVCIYIYIQYIYIYIYTGRRLRYVEDLIWNSLNSKDTGRPRLTHHHSVDNMKRIRWAWRNGWEKQEKPKDKRTQNPIRPPQNTDGVTERRTREPSDGRRAINRLRHGAAKKNVMEITTFSE